jgi:hypothetical protein
MNKDELAKKDPSVLIGAVGPTVGEEVGIGVGAGWD